MQNLGVSRLLGCGTGAWFVPNCLCWLIQSIIASALVAINLGILRDVSLLRPPCTYYIWIFAANFILSYALRVYCHSFLQLCPRSSFCCSNFGIKVTKVRKLLLLRCVLTDVSIYNFFCNTFIVKCLLECFLFMSLINLLKLWQIIFQNIFI